MPHHEVIVFVQPRYTVFGMMDIVFLGVPASWLDETCPTEIIPANALFLTKGCLLSWVVDRRQLLLFTHTHKQPGKNVGPQRQVCSERAPL